MPNPRNVIVGQKSANAPYPRDVIVGQKSANAPYPRDVIVGQKSANAPYPRDVIVGQKSANAPYPLQKKALVKEVTSEIGIYRNLINCVKKGNKATLSGIGI